MIKIDDILNYMPTLKTKKAQKAQVNQKKTTNTYLTNQAQ